MHYESPVRPVLRRRAAQALAVSEPRGGDPCGRLDRLLVLRRRSRQPGDCRAGSSARRGSGGSIAAVRNRSAAFRSGSRCAAPMPSVELPNCSPPLSVRMGDVLIAAQIYQPTLLIGEWAAPLTVAEPGQPPKMTATWTLMQTSVRGRPRAPERISIVPKIRPSNASMRRHVGAHGRGQARRNSSRAWRRARCRTVR